MALGTTVDSLVGRVRRDALMASRGPVYTLDGAYTAGGVSLVLNESFTTIGIGALISIDYELFYVQATNQGTRTVTVIPGYFGTTQANHADNAIVEVDPRMPASMLLDFAEMEIRSWGSELFRVTPIEVGVTARDRTYDLGIAAGQDIYSILDIRIKPPAGAQSSSWWNFNWVGNAHVRSQARLLRNQSVSDFPSGYALQLNEAPRRSTTVRVWLAQPFDLDPFTGSTDLVSAVGLKPDWFDIVEFGARWRALQGIAVGRTDWRRGSMSRESEEVSAVDTIRAASQAADMRTLRFTKAAVDLRGEWPYQERFG